MQVHHGLAYAQQLLAEGWVRLSRGGNYGNDAVYGVVWDPETAWNEGAIVFIADGIGFTSTLIRRLWLRVEMRWASPRSLGRDVETLWTPGWFAPLASSLYLDGIEHIDHSVGSDRTRQTAVWNDVFETARRAVDEVKRNPDVGTAIAAAHQLNGRSGVRLLVAR